MAASIFLDTREHALIGAMPNAVVKNLELGDINIIMGDALFVFERKTLADVAASVKDGRYREQKARILASVPAHRVTYIIEYNDHNPIPKDDKKYGMSRDVYTGVYMSLLYRDGIHVLFLKDTAEIAQWITDFAQKLMRDPSKYICTAGAAGAACSYSDSLKIKSQKQANLNKDLVYKLMISQIPGVSMKLAENIAEKYPNLKSLLDNLTIKKLQEIELIGKKKAQTIIEYLS